MSYHDRPHYNLSLHHGCIPNSWISICFVNVSDLLACYFYYFCIISHPPVLATCSNNLKLSYTIIQIFVIICYWILICLIDLSDLPGRWSNYFCIFKQPLTLTNCSNNLKLICTIGHIRVTISPFPKRCSNSNSFLCQLAPANDNTVIGTSNIVDLYLFIATSSAFFISLYLPRSNIVPRLFNFQQHYSHPYPVNSDLYLSLTLGVACTRTSHDSQPINLH